MTLLTDILYLLAVIIGSPVILFAILVRGKWRHGWSERLGGGPAPAGDRPVVWVHAVSVGEANATRTLVEQLQAARPNVEIVFSTTTDTGAERLAKLYPDAVRFRYPLDFSLIARRALNRIRPALIVLIELEVWPNMVRLASARGIPVAVINGRLSEHSFRSYRRLRWLLGGAFARLAGAFAQDEDYAERFTAMGTPPARVEVTGSLKYDTAQVADRVDGDAELAAELGIGDDTRLLVAGSTGPGEEPILLDVWEQLRADFPQLRLAVVPRKPERFDEVAQLIAGRGLACIRRSEHRDASTAAALGPDGVILGDTMGELRKFYALSEVAFVGRSLAPMGGSDVMEVAALGLPVVVGPHMDNFAEPTRRLAAAGGLATVADAAGLAGVLRSLLNDTERREKMAAAARQAVIDAQGATARTVSGLTRLLDDGR